jgi:hypothetical protein
LGLYGLLIGLCGNQNDSKVLEKKILEKTEDFRLGIDGLMSGYLLLTGDKGLAVLDEHKLKNRDVPFSETYAAMQALRFMWKYSEGRIEKSRLRASMRILLDRPELADLVIADLARWKDWEIQDRLMELYVLALASDSDDKGDDEADDKGNNEADDRAADLQKALECIAARDPKMKVDVAEPFNVPSIKRAIIRYMLVSTKDVPDEATSGEDSVIPEHATKGKKYVDVLRQLDPKTVAQAERFFFLK